MTTPSEPAAPLLVDALRCRPVPRRPAWIMRQAGRYLPEYRRMKEQHSFLELAGDPALAAEVTLLPFRHFALDAAIVFADIMSPMAALGIDVRFAPGPVIDHPLRSAQDVDALPTPDPAAAAPEVVAALQRARAELPPEVATIGFAGAPLTLAAYLVQGHGKTDFPWLRAFAAADPAAFSRLLARLARLVAGFLRRQVEVGGAQAIQIFESWAGLLGADDWGRLVRPHLRDLLQEVGRSGAPRILFLHHPGPVLDRILGPDPDGLASAGAEGRPIGGLLHGDPAHPDLPFEALAVDWRQDPAAVRRRLPDDRALQGNLDPALLLAGPDAVRAGLRALLARVPRRGHVVNLGHGIHPQTPLESVDAFLEVVHAEAGSPVPAPASLP